MKRDVLRSQNFVHDAAEIARAESEHDADRQVHERRDEADGQRYAATVEEADDLAAADLVGAQEVRELIESRLLVGVEQVLLLEGVLEHVLREEVGAGREYREQHEHDHRGDREPIVPELPQGVRPEAAGWPDERVVRGDGADGARGRGHYLTTIRGSTTA